MPYTFGKLGASCTCFPKPVGQNLKFLPRLVCDIPLLICNAVHIWNVGRQLYMKSKTRRTKPGVSPKVVLGSPTPLKLSREISPRLIYYILRVTDDAVHICNVGRRLYMKSKTRKVKPGVCLKVEIIYSTFNWRCRAHVQRWAPIVHEVQTP